MKLRNIFLFGIAGLSLASCTDYLEVDAPSKNQPDYVYTDKMEMNRALNGVYAALLSGNTYGSAFLDKFCFNTDVEFKIYDNENQLPTAYQRFECDPDAGDVKKAWDALYQGIERANMLDAGIRNSDIYDEDDSELMQMLGEVKVLRAIFYHDLIWYWGDVPYSLKPSYEVADPAYDIEDRTKILDDLIEDLKAIAPKMSLSSDNSFSDRTERISKDMAWAMIARLAMTAGGYSLRPDGDTFGKMERPDNWKDYYQTAAEYCDSVVERTTHSLGLDYHKVFVNECNLVASATNDDVIFEIPFGKESTGAIGYIHGPKMDNAQGSTPHAWGKASSSAQLNALYRLFFKEGDVRRDYVNQWFGYNQNGEAKFNNGRTFYNGKWSKLWNTAGLGATTEGNTGINFPYMRYADVLLMSAEAELGYTGNVTEKAKQRLQTVRERAYRGSTLDPAVTGDETSPEGFLKAVLNERRLEFAGENMRWRDLVRNNLLSESTFWTFWRYFNAAEANGSNSDYVGIYDFDDADAYPNKLVFKIYYSENLPTVDTNGNKIDYQSRLTSANKDGVGASRTFPAFPTASTFPNESGNMNIVYVLNPYTQPWNKIGDNLPDTKNKASSADFMNWFNNDLGCPSAHFCYSLRGYIYYDPARSTTYVNRNGKYEAAPEPSAMPTTDDLPVVRYILPIPRSIITYSQGKYTNKYGYK
ncbi:MAG: RagB/SusD family nutrient uptake outer membrane protein [Bacteroides sp.]|nr:RagB/SusD family nutrient uptake outer membrane protein [Bacteroides sp.]